MSHQNRSISKEPVRIRTSWSALVTLSGISLAIWLLLTREAEPPTPVMIESMPLAISHEDMRTQTEAIVRQTVGYELSVHGRVQAEIEESQAFLKCSATGSEIWHHRFFIGVFEREGLGFRFVRLIEN